MADITLKDLAEKIDGAEKRITAKIDSEIGSLREEMNGNFAGLTATLVQKGVIRKSA